MAEVLYHENRGHHTEDDLDEIEQFLEVADSYKNYPLEDILKTRIKMALKQVRNEKN